MDGMGRVGETARPSTARTPGGAVLPAGKGGVVCRAGVRVGTALPEEGAMYAESCDAARTKS